MPEGNGAVRLLCGDAAEMLATLPAASAHCAITSPPFFGLRDYGTGTWEGGEPACAHDRNHREARELTGGGCASWSSREDSSRAADCPCGARRVDRQLGLESTPEEYVARMVQVFREVKRLLRDDGTLWLNLGDSYGGNSVVGRRDPDRKERMPGSWSQVLNGAPMQGRTTRAGGAKQLLGMPWRVAFALQADGWYLRSDIIWAKPNPMPESVRDRPTKSHEYLFLLAKSEKYYYDAEAMREPAEYAGANAIRVNAGALEQEADPIRFRTRPAGRTCGYPERRNLRSVWTIATAPFKGAHFATFPPVLVEPCVKAGTSERGVCGACGAPWVRMVEREARQSPRPLAADLASRAGYGEANDGRTRPAGYRPLPPTVETTGWRPSCACPAAEPVPATILDCFAGAGTTGLVARRHGRHFVGIDLSREYLDMARRRLQGDAPLFWWADQEGNGNGHE